jgi:hypothetical protein
LSSRPVLAFLFRPQPASPTTAPSSASNTSGGWLTDYGRSPVAKCAVASLQDVLGLKERGNQLVGEALNAVKHASPFQGVRYQAARGTAACLADAGRLSEAMEAAHLSIGGTVTDTLAERSARHAPSAALQALRRRALDENNGSWSSSAVVSLLVLRHEVPLDELASRDVFHADRAGGGAPQASQTSRGCSITRRTRWPAHSAPSTSQHHKRAR